MAARKNDHIRICSEEAVEGAARVAQQAVLKPCSFPEMDLADVSTQARFLNRTFAMPVLITGMTGGVEYGQRINEVLAACAERFSIPMGLGSQKLMLADVKTSPLFQLRKVAPRAFLMGNLGAVSLNYGVSVDDVLRLVERCELNAFALHINALQECIQPEGERNFKNLFGAIETLLKKLPVPLLVKEVGAGLDENSALRLAEMGVQAIDVGGRGGTSWSYIEGRRGDEMSARLGTLFRDWGYGTEAALSACVKLAQARKLKTEWVATGGVRDGVQIAKLVGLGASMAGVGLPLFRAAVNAIQAGHSNDAAISDVSFELEFLQRSLAIAMFCTGAQTLADLPSRVEKNQKDVG